jgi:hypothetical protein
MSKDHRQGAVPIDVPPPPVRWRDGPLPNEYDALEREGRAVEALIPEVWGELPPPYRHIIGGTVDCLHVSEFSSRRIAGAVNPCHQGEQVTHISVAFLEDPWEAHLRVRVIEALAHACAWGMATWIYAAGPEASDSPGDSRGTHAATWWGTLLQGLPAQRKEVVYDLDRLGRVLPLVWGYGERWAEFAHLQAFTNPSPGASTPWLEAEIGKVHRVFQRRMTEPLNRGQRSS